MKIAFISDLHANLIALEAVLADIEAAGADEIICLGDIASLGPQPCEVTALIRELGCATIQGNHDPLPEESSVLRPVGEWTEQQLGDEDKRFLATLPPTLTRELQDLTLLCVHGSPSSFDEQILPSTSEADLEPMFAHSNFDVIVAGHTHVQMFRRYRNRAIVGVGSVGMPYVAPFDGSGPPQIVKAAEYALVAHNNGALTVDLRQVPYDFETYREAVRSSGLPFPGWCDQWVD